MWATKPRTGKERKDEERRDERQDERRGKRRGQRREEEIRGKDRKDREGP